MKIEKVRSLPGNEVEIVASCVDAEAKRKLARAFFTEEPLFPMFAEEVCDCLTEELDIVGLWQSKDRTALKLADGRVFRARPEAGDKYDPEKGVMMCLLKACGISSSDFIKIMESVERVEPPKTKNIPEKKLKSKK